MTRGELLALLDDLQWHRDDRDRVVCPCCGVDGPEAEYHVGAPPTEIPGQPHDADCRVQTAISELRAAGHLDLPISTIVTEPPAITDGPQNVRCG